MDAITNTAELVLDIVPTATAEAAATGAVIAAQTAGSVAKTLAQRALAGATATGSVALVVVASPMVVGAAIGASAVAAGFLAHRHYPLAKAKVLAWNEERKARKAAKLEVTIPASAPVAEAVHAAAE
jgi:hypothetical protein